MGVLIYKLKSDYDYIHLLFLRIPLYSICTSVKKAVIDLKYDFDSKK
jgi:hypothetical protein